MKARVGFALVSLLAAYLLANAGLGWKYIHDLTHPGCPTPTLPAGLAPPEEVWLAVKDLKLRAWYYPSQNGAAILALGGLHGALGDNLPPSIFLVRHGYGVLQLDTRACARPAAAVTLGAQEVWDATAGLQFLAGRPEVERIGAIGFSMGGATVLRAAARETKIAAVVAEGGYYNLGEDIVEADAALPIWQSVILYNVAGAFWLQSGINPWQVSPLADLPRLSPRPVLLIYGEKEAASGHAREQWAAAGEPRTLWIVADTGHGQAYQADPAAYEQRVLQFFDQALQPHVRITYRSASRSR